MPPSEIWPPRGTPATVCLHGGLLWGVRYAWPVRPPCLPMWEPFLGQSRSAPEPHSLYRDGKAWDIVVVSGNGHVSQARTVRGKIEEIRALRGHLSAVETKKRFGIGSTRLYKIWRDESPQQPTDPAQNILPYGVVGA